MSSFSVMFSNIKCIKMCINLFVCCRGCIEVYSLTHSSIRSSCDMETHVWQCCVTPGTPRAPIPSWVSGRVWARECACPRAHMLSRARHFASVRPPAPVAPSWSWMSPRYWAPEKAGPPPPPPPPACARPYASQIPETSTGTRAR